MASFLNKAKDKIQATLDQKNNKGDDPRSDNYGSHSSNVVNRADPQVDSDLDHRNDPTSRVGGYGHTQGHDQYGDARGTGGFASSDTYGSSANAPGYDDPRSTNTGPHSSNLMNRADPRVDSDRDNRNDPTSRVGGYGNTQQYGDTYGQAGGAGGFQTTDTGYGRHTGPGTTGYSGDTMQTGHPGTSSGLAAHTTTGTGGFGSNTGYGGTSDTYDDPRSTNAGPHKSNFMNKLDPRADSDNDNRNDPTSRVGGYGGQGESLGHSTHGHTAHSATTTGGVGGYNTTGTSSTGTFGHSTGHAERYGDTTTGTTGGYTDSNFTPGSGNTRDTAGPHNSNLMNKLDPRVDSDMDSSRTYGGNATYR